MHLTLIIHPALPMPRAGVYVGCMYHEYVGAHPTLPLYPTLTKPRAGVYVGCMYHEYVAAQAAAGAPLPPQAFIGSGAPYLVGRLSYTFGLTGERYDLS